MSDGSERLRTAARKAREHGDFGDLLLLLLAPPNQGRKPHMPAGPVPEASVFMGTIRARMFSAGFSRDRAEIEAEAAALTFLEKRLKTGSLLAQLADASYPYALLKRAALNAAVDHLRTLVRTFELDREVVEEAEAGLPDGQAPSNPSGLDDDLARHEAQETGAARMVEAHAALGVEDALLLEVLRPEAVPMPPGHANSLARRRNIPHETLAAELDTRRAEREKDVAAESRMRGLEVRLSRLQDRTRWAQALIVECRDDGSAAPAELTTKQLRRLAVSASAFRAASPAERAALLQRLHQRTVDTEKNLAEVGKRINRGHLADWREVARILGEVPEDPTEEQLKLAANRLVTRWRRLRAKLQTVKSEEQS